MSILKVWLVVERFIVRFYEVIYKLEKRRGFFGLRFGFFEVGENFVFCLGFFLVLFLVSYFFKIYF